MKRRTSILITLATMSALLIGLVGATTAIGYKGKGSEGCTPGYWKVAQHHDSWPAEYKPAEGAGADSFDAVFGVDFFSPDKTLLQAMWTGGGGKYALARHAVAALFNANVNVDVSYKYDTAEVIEIVQDAYASGDYGGAKSMLAPFNEKYCPLS